MRTGRFAGIFFYRYIREVGGGVRCVRNGRIIGGRSTSLRFDAWNHLRSRIGLINVLVRSLFFEYIS